MNECVQYEIIQHKATINVFFAFIFQKKKKKKLPIHQSMIPPIFYDLI